MADLNQAYRRIDELSTEAESNLLLAKKFKGQADNASELLKGQSNLLDKSISINEKQHRQKQRWKRMTLVSFCAAFVGGFYISSTL